MSISFFFLYGESFKWLLIKTQSIKVSGWTSSESRGGGRLLRRRRLIFITTRADNV